MLIIKGIYDGNSFVALEEFPTDKTYNVIITFIEELNDSEELRQFSAQTDGFSFCNDERENLFQDYLTLNK